MESGHAGGRENPKSLTGSIMRLFPEITACWLMMFPVASLQSAESAGYPINDTVMYAEYRIHSEWHTGIASFACKRHDDGRSSLTISTIDGQGQQKSAVLWVDAIITGWNHRIEHNGNRFLVVHTITGASLTGLMVVGLSGVAPIVEADLAGRFGVSIIDHNTDGLFDLVQVDGDLDGPAVYEIFEQQRSGAFTSVEQGRAAWPYGVVFSP
jgi:hypothetical protein